MQWYSLSARFGGTDPAAEALTPPRPPEPFPCWVCTAPMQMTSAVSGWCVSCEVGESRESCGIGESREPHPGRPLTVIRPHP